MSVKIVAITRVLNEADVIEALVRHTAAYVQHHIFMDNGSADGTLQILEALAREGLPITVFQSRAVTFNEADGLTFMYHHANREHAPDWVLCVDADEFIDDRKIDGGLRAYLENFTATNDPVECISIPMVNYIATSRDVADEPNVALRMTQRQPEPLDAYKIILKGGLPEGDLVIQHGSHWASMTSRELVQIKNRDLWLAHYPERSSFQYIAKFVRGWSKVLATGPSEVAKKTAYHYQPAYEVLRDRPQDLLKNAHFMGFKNEHDANVRDPIAYKGGPLTHTGAPDEAMRATRVLMGFFQELATSHGRILEEVPGARAQVRAWEDEVTRILDTPGHTPGVLTPPPDCVDLTEGALTNQSSVSKWSVSPTTESDSANAIAKEIFSPYAFHTGEEEHPWWSIDFGKPVLVKEVRIYNRIDDPACAARGARFAIEASDMPFSTWTELFRRDSDVAFGGIDGKPFIWRSAQPAPMALLRIRLLEGKMMHFQKIEVFGTRLQTV